MVVSEEVTEQSLKAAFSKFDLTLVDPQAVEACVKTAEEFGMNAEQLAENYEILMSTKEIFINEVKATSITSTEFRKVLTKQQAASKGHGAARTGAPKLPFGSSWENVADHEPLTYQPTPKRRATDSHNVQGVNTGAHTPVMPARPPSVLGTPGRPPVMGGLPHLTPPGTATKFASRTNRGQTVSVYNEGVPALASRPSSRPLCTLEVVGEQLPPAGKHRYMVETLETKIQATEERVLDWGEVVRAALPAGEAADACSSSVGAVTQAPVWVVGRVVSEASAEGSGACTALGEASVMLEGSREASDGVRMRLDISGVASTQGYRLFPGQVIAAKGLNPSGQLFVAQQLCSHLPPPPPAAPAPGPASVVVAAGPYTPSDDLGYEPLTDLLAYCAEVQPDALVLCGPLVDGEQAAVQGGTLDLTYQELFTQVQHKLAEWQASNPGVRVVLLPSVRDAHHPPVFPTPAYALQGGPTPPGLSSLQSPTTFSIAQGLVVAASSADVMKALSSSELARLPAGQGQDRLAALASHIVGQRSFFPVYPPPPGTCLDLSAAHHLALTCTPHVLITPSDIAPFAKPLPTNPPGSLASSDASDAAVPTTVAVNPGRLVRGSGGGTFAHVTLQGGEGPVGSRLRVEVRRV